MQIRVTKEIISQVFGEHISKHLVSASFWCYESTPQSEFSMLLDSSVYLWLTDLHKMDGNFKFHGLGTVGNNIMLDFDYINIKQ